MFILYIIFLPLSDICHIITVSWRVNMTGMTFNLRGEVWRWSVGEGRRVLDVNTWYSTQPGRLMVLTASAQWLGIRGCNWVETRYGHPRQLLIAGANHMLSSLPRFQLFATSGKDTRISCAQDKLLWDFVLDYLSYVWRGSFKNQTSIILESYTEKE